MAAKTQALYLATIRTYPLPKVGSKLIRDGGCEGLAVRLTATGSRTFVACYMVTGRERRMTLGPVAMGDGDSGLTLTAARARVGKVRSQARDGGDPLAERQAKIRAETFREFWEDYVNAREHELRPATMADYRSIAAQYLLPALGSRKLAEITTHDIKALHRKITRAGHPYRANRVLALLSAMFRCAVNDKLHKDVTVNPAAAAAVARNPERGRERFLTPDEIARLFEALRTHEQGSPRRQSACNIIRLLLLTGARRGEVLGARWEHFDLRAGVWTKPAATTKQKKMHHVPLSPQAIALLKSLPADSDLLFPSASNSGALTGLKRAWSAVCTLAGLENVRIHDLRHSFASLAISGGIPLAVVGGLLGHTQAQTTQRYAHLHDEVQRAATGAVGAIIGHADTGRTAEVVPLRRA